MENTKIMIGCNYEVLVNHGKYMKKGEVLKACYYGHFVLTKMKEGKITNVEFTYNTSRFLNLIKENKVKLIPDTQSAFMYSK